MPPRAPIAVDDFTDPRAFVLRAKKRRAWLVRAPMAATRWVASLKWSPVEVKRLAVSSHTTGVLAPSSHSRAHPVIAADAPRFHFAPGRETLEVAWELVGAPFVTQICFELFSSAHAHDDGRSRLLWRRTLRWNRGECPAQGSIALTGAFDDVPALAEALGPVQGDQPWLDDAAFDPLAPPHVLSSRLSPYKLKLTIENPANDLYLVKPARWAYLEVVAKDVPPTPFSDAPCRELHAVHVGRDADNHAPCMVYHRELQALATLHKFHALAGWNVATDAGTEWLRDTQIVRDNGGFLLPRTSEDIHDQTAKPRSEINWDLEDRSKAFAARREGAYIDNDHHPDRDQVPYRVVSTPISRSAGAHAQRQSWDNHHGDSVIEGGNILVTTRRGGRPRALVGDLSLLQTMAALQWRGTIAPIVGDTFDPALELDALKQTDAPLGLQPALEAAAHVIAADLHIPVEDVLIVEQLAFHLDMCMAVGPDDTILLQDHALSRALLERLADTTTEDDRELLRGYLEYATELGRSLAALTDRVADTLARAGYRVRRVAAVFVNGRDGLPINFMNHIAGTDDAGQMFYVTNAAPETALGEAIEASFEDVLRELGYGAVHFIGTGGAAQRSLRNMGALRCLTAVQPYPYRRSDE